MRTFIKINIILIYFSDKSIFLIYKSYKFIKPSKFKIIKQFYSLTKFSIIQRIRIDFALNIRMCSMIDFKENFVSYLFPFINFNH